MCLPSSYYFISSSKPSHCVMKILNIALHALLATIGTAPRAHARIASSLRDPRTVEEKEDVRRQTMGTHFVSIVSDGKVNTDTGETCDQRISAVAEAKLQTAETQNVKMSQEEATSLACSDVSKQYPVCLGCQGYERKVRYDIVLPCSMYRFVLYTLVVRFVLANTCSNMMLH